MIDDLQVLLEGIQLWDPIYWNLHIIQSDQVRARESCSAAVCSEQSCPPFAEKHCAGQAAAVPFMTGHCPDALHAHTRIAGRWQVEVRGLTIWGDPAVPNNDGMDIDSSSNVLVTHTNVSALDDAICIKTDDGELSQLKLHMIPACWRQEPCSGGSWQPWPGWQGTTRHAAAATGACAQVSGPWST